MKVYNEFWEWIQGVEWLNIIITGAKMIIILLLAFIILTVLKKILRKTLEKNSALQENRRAVTMTSILYSISKYIIYFIAVMVVFSMMGIDIAPVLASAGVLGLAVGFGAQNLVKDTISGFFIIFDNYFSVGDYIKTCGVSGFVEEIGLRTTKIRDWAGEVHIFPNGSVDLVTNYSKGKLNSFVQIPVSYESDLQEALDVLQKVCHQMAEDFPDLAEDPKVLGVDKLENARILLKVMFNCDLNSQVNLERELLKRSKEAFDKADIAMPYYKNITINDYGQEKGKL